MFKKLKTLLFEEEVEIEEETHLTYTLDEQNETPTKVNNDGYSQNEETVVSESIVKPIIKRIDVDETIPQEPIEKQVPVKPTPTPLANHSQRKKAAKEYKPKAVISPMFGLTEAEMQKTVQIEEMTKKNVKESINSKIISPIFGQVKPEDTPVIGKSQRPPKKNQKVNFTLEEMLNVDNQEELEFTLFDVPLDAREFQSRENKKFLKADETLDDTDGLKIMKGDNE